MPAPIDITGHMFGKLTAIEIAGREVRPNGKYRTIWRYQCKCGAYVERLPANIATSLAHGYVPACDKCRVRHHPIHLEPRRLEIAGQKLGKLTAIQPLRTNRKRNIIWLFQCECGRLVEKVASEVVACSKDWNISCGSKECKRRVTGGHGRRNKIGSYKRSANDRGIAFELTEEQMDILFAGDCYYCGAAPSESSVGFISNGIDRLDSSVGYITGNVVSCCSVCNRAKFTKSSGEFLAWINQVWEHQNGHKD